MMNVKFDCIDGDHLIWFNQKPEGDKYLLIAKMKEYGMSWDPNSKHWKGPLSSIEAWDASNFRARVKATADNLSFFYGDEEVDMIDFLERVKAYNPDAIDDDLSSMSKVPNGAGGPSNSASAGVGTPMRRPTATVASASDTMQNKRQRSN